MPRAAARRLPWADSGRGYRPSRRRPTAGAITPNQAARRLCADFRRRQHKIDQAIVEYRTAIGIDPEDASAHYNLGMALRALAFSLPSSGERASRLRDSCSAMLQGAELARVNYNFIARIKELDALLPDHCPPK